MQFRVGLRPRAALVVGKGAVMAEARRVAEAKSGQIDHVMREERLFPPPPEFAAKARIGSIEQYEQLWHEAAADIPAFWGSWPASCTGSSPTPRCSAGTSPLPSGSSAARPTSATTVSTSTWTPPRRNKAAVIWEGEPGDVRVFTYQMLHHEVCRFANVLKSLGIRPGRRGLDLHAAGARVDDRHARLRGSAPCIA